MRTRFLFVILIALTLLNGCIFEPNERTEKDTPIAKPVAITESYMPLCENASWVYSASKTNKSGAIVSSSKFTTNVVGKKTVNGKYCWMVKNPEGKNDVKFIYVENNVVFDVNRDNLLERQILNFEIEPGKTWNITCDNNTTVVGSFDGYETQRISSGTYENTARFTKTTITKVKYMKNGKKHCKESREDNVVWYAKNVGLIKEVNIISENMDIVEFTVKELSKYNLAG